MTGKEAKRAYDRAYHAKRSQEKKERKQALQAARKGNITHAVREYKAAIGCQDCGENDPIVLDLDHRERLSKVDSVSELIRKGYSLGAVMREAVKCDVVCANCHRKRTAKQMGWNVRSIRPDH